MVKSHRIVNNIPRFVNRDKFLILENNGINFKTQLDSYSGLNISEKRLENSINAPLNNLSNKYILEAGSKEDLLKYY